jgi:hypothetical protein
MPITRPALLTSGPPESPGSRSPLISISPVSCSTLPSNSSPAVIDWSSATIDPSAALA